jgi:aspartyl-tRNA(Asn)/glutamyl-tRNA(Gln) amidotransferase subunit B
LSPLEISEQWLSDIRQQMPTLPWEQEQKFMELYHLSAYDAHFLAETREMALYFEAAAQLTKSYKPVANWLMGPVKSHLNDKGLSIQDFELNPGQLVEIVELVEQGIITHNLAVQQLFGLCLSAPTNSPKQIVEEQGWLNLDSSDELPGFVEAALAAYPAKIKEYHQGKKGLIALFIGEVMKRSKGTADPKRVNQLVSEALEKQK